MKKRSRRKAALSLLILSLCLLSVSYTHLTLPTIRLV